jgi:hypothetical protein
MLLDLVRRARRRFLWNEILAQAACSASVALAGFVLLLLLGTQILDWRWLAPVPLIAFAAGIWRVWRRLPSRYAVARIIDQRLGLADTLSTALYFAAHGVDRAAEGVRRAQFDRAERAAAQASARQAVPLTMPRGIYAMALLGLVASSLFALRYGLERRLDLQPPLARVIQDAFGFGQPEQVQQARRKPQPEERPEWQETSVPVAEADGGEPGELDAATDEALETVGVPEVDNSASGVSKARSPGDKQAEGETGEGEAADGTELGSGKESEGQKGQGAGKQQGQQSGAQSQGSSGDKSSLMAKFRDAMNNLLSRMRQQQDNSGAQQQAGAQQDSRDGKNQAGNGSQAGKDGRQAGGQESDSQDGQPGEEGQNAQNAQGRGSGQSADQASNKQPGSGIGKQDGSKDTKLAEQLAAMGKISEIIGKRSANVTGEVTIEVQSSDQTLRTPYSKRAARHGDSGGEINRDEVPVALQPYVQQYFEQVRKLAPPKGSGAADRGR